MRITCPSCQKTLRVNDRLAGKRIKCPACGQVLLVPDLSEAIIEAVDEPPPPRKPRPLPQEAVSATRPAKRRLIDDADAPRPKKRRPLDDEPDEDEDRPRKKKKRKKAAAPLVSWPILAAGGGLIGVAAIVLVVVLILNREPTGATSAGTKGGGLPAGDNQAVAVKLLVPHKVGQVRDVEVVADASNEVRGKAVARAAREQQDAIQGEGQDPRHRPARSGDSRGDHDQ